jgi:hypothetical protein
VRVGLGTGPIGLRARRPVVFGSLGVLVFGVVALGGSVAQASPHRLSVTAKVPAGIAAGFRAVAAVPHSSDAWSLASAGSVANEHYFLGHLHHGHWSKVKLPKFGGRYGELNAITAGSAGSVWLAGAKQQGGGSIQDFPAIWRWSGKRFVAQKLPKLLAGDYQINAISASSATNAWAVGSIFTAAAQYVSLHWNGKTWSAVDNPNGDEEISAVSTSAPDNAWLTDGALLYHWDGKSLTNVGAAPSGTALFGVATSSSKLAYAVGESGTLTGIYRPMIMRFNGTKWLRVSLGKHLPQGNLLSVAMHGASVWAAGNNLALHSTGGAWRRQVLGKDYHFDAVSAASSHRAYAVGAWTNDITVKSFFEVSNGHTWSAKPSKF